ncbi:MAG: nucleoid occlusion protein [Acidaminococcaceae bacterium]|jgi:ParB family chromosome partitioning protein|nr:nucleoid occlusion protein [Acidaminococcaceae bacterium]MBO6265008.1 nucleoid occlusion protein [Acidaminococcaceae bacterium]MBQ9320329.1 nucleoid occlusion protein [Acidaminococcaceae bacterium]MBR1512287.1 nucleoid occlusion protein [Acidaminococcaceae bacterium]
MKGEALQKNTDVQVLYVPLSKIVPNPYQPRKEFESEALSELADSIRQYGVLQPLLVAPGPDNNYILIAGERRLRASTMAGMGSVPVIVSEYTTQQIAEIALIENLQRKDLHYLEEAEGYEKLVNTFHLTQESMAGRVGKKQSTIANKLRLLKLSPSVRNTLHESDLTERHARALLKLENEETQKTVLKKIIKDHLNVKQTEALIDKTLKQEGKLNKKKPRIVIVNDVRIYLNSIKNIMDAVKNSGIPSCMEQEMDGDDVVVTLRIKNVKKRKDPNVIKLF